MAKYEMKFKDIEKENTTIQCEVFDLNQIQILTTVKGFVTTAIYLDKSTAIKFAKTLRTEINKITEMEGGKNV